MARASPLKRREKLADWLYWLSGRSNPERKKGVSWRFKKQLSFQSSWASADTYRSGPGLGRGGVIAVLFDQVGNETSCKPPELQPVN